MTLTAIEERALRALDDLCYDDLEANGEGWVGAVELAGEMRVGWQWASKIASRLAAYGLVERRREQNRSYSRWLYALSEAGGVYLHPDQATERDR